MSDRVLSMFCEQLLQLKSPSQAKQSAIGLSVWHGGDTARRFLIHRNNRLVGLIDHLAETFSVVKALVGDEFFNGMSIEYLGQLRLDPPILNVMGGSFSSFISQFEHAQDLPYLADLARLEFARVVAFHAENTVAMSASDVANVLRTMEGCSPELLSLAAFHVKLHPSITVIESSFAIQSIWAAHQREEAEQAQALTSIDVSCAQSVIVFRSGWQPVVMEVDEGYACVISRLNEGVSLDVALAARGSVDEFGELDVAALISFLVQNELMTHFSINLGGYDDK